MPNHDALGISFIGAGAICEQRHLPGLAQCPEVQLVSVCNRSDKGSHRVAEEWGFARTASDWPQVLADSEVDAVFIGTWPYMHRELSIAALAAGKHVFCQARMCMNAREAEEMVAAASTHAELVSMICPSPHRVQWERTIKRLLAEGQLGELRSVVVVSTSAANANLNQVGWRERIELSGLNILQVGIFAETLNAWCGEYASLVANCRVLIGEKRDASGERVAIEIPQLVSITGTLAGGQQATEYHTGLAVGHERSQIVLLGSAATCTVDLLAQRISLESGKSSGSTVLDDRPDEWQVERQFVDAVLAAQRSEAWQVSPSFAEASRYMRKMQAIHDSAAESRVVALS